MKGILISILVLMTFNVFAQKADTVSKHVVKKQYLSKIIGITNDNRPMIFINDTIYHGEMDSIDMDKVEKLEVVKNSTEAVQIWGKGAENGVVQIITKTAAVDNMVLPPSTVIKRKDIIIVDGELYAHNLKDLNPNEIYKIDVLKNEKIADLGGDANSVTVVITKKGARLYYQYKLAKYCESYRDYIRQYQNDSKIKYLLNAKAANMDVLYNLKPDSINKVTFVRNNSNPVVKIITK